MLRSVSRPATHVVSGAPGRRIKYVNTQLSIAAIEMTNVTAQPMPKAMSTRRDTPMNGQMPTK